MAQMPATEEVRELVEARKIERVLYDYAYHLDLNQPEAMLDFFCEDCEVSYAPNFGASGKDAYAATLDGIGTYFAGTTHHVSNVIIDFVEPDVAHVRSALIALHRYQRERPDGWMFGQYHDVMVRGENGGWRFKRRELRQTLAIDYHVRTAHPIGRAA